MANASLDNGSRNIINDINTGTSVSTLNADGTFNGKGQGILRTEDGHVATWTNQVVGNLTREGTIVSRGVGFWSTPSEMGELAFMNGMISVFEVQVDRGKSICQGMGVEIGTASKYPRSPSPP
ncbi:MAG: hypothetical protein ACJ709_02145 [Nitrososphaeraceae archaeon]